MEKIDTDKIIERLSRSTENIDKVVDAVSFVGLYSLWSNYSKSSKEAFEATALSYLLFKSGSEAGVAAIMGSIAVSAFMKNNFNAIPPMQDLPGDQR